MSKSKRPSTPLALGPEDLADPMDTPLDMDVLRKAISRHLDSHLPILIEYAVVNAVEPIARNLSDQLRKAVIERLKEDRESLIDDIIDEISKGSAGE